MQQKRTQVKEATDTPGCVEFRQNWAHSLANPSARVAQIVVKMGSHISAVDPVEFVHYQTLQNLK